MSVKFGVSKYPDGDVDDMIMYSSIEPAETQARTLAQDCGIAYIFRVEVEHMLTAKQEVVFFSSEEKDVTSFT